MCEVIFRFWFQQASNPPSNAAPSWKQKKQQISAVNGGSSAPPKPAKPPHTSAPSFASGGGGTARFVPPTDGPANIAMAMEATAEIQGMLTNRARIQRSSKTEEISTSKGNYHLNNGLRMKVERMSSNYSAHSKTYIFFHCNISV